MKNVWKYALVFLMVIAGAFVGVLVYSSFFEKPRIVTIKETAPVKLASYPASEGNLPDLTYAAESTVNAVVHIMTESVQGGWSSGNPLLDFFGYRSEPQVAQGFGSGVILSSDGFIVTNNHVIDDAQKIKVVLNDRREFEARLIGADPATDVALLKIDGTNLPFLTYGNSSDLKLGEWVLAIGNPFNLTSTVTAGIISAKARNIGINGDRSNIESFIQTDAAVNPGNSGGALVNQRGELVGINTALASRTGSYAGYSFAIPTTIVRKVVDDLKKYGEVQRALLGVEIRGVDADVAKEFKLEKIEGVYVAGVTENGAAKEAGIKSGDVILEIQGRKVNTNAELQESISQYHPGDMVNITVKRNNSEKLFTVKLRNKLGNTGIVHETNDLYGSQFESLKALDKEKFQLDRGIKVTKVGSGKLKDAGLVQGFIITDVNKKPVYDVDDLKRIVTNAKGGILVEGLLPDGSPAYFVFGNK
jgi:serine protease Do